MKGRTKGGAALSLALLAFWPGSLAAQLRAGAARRPITPDLEAGKVWIAGFGQNRAATGVHDDLWARCLALGDRRRTVVLCALDLIGLLLGDVERIRQAVRKSLPETAVIVAATHNHQGPDTLGLWGPAPGTSGRNPDYILRVVERTAEAAVEAVRHMRPAQLKPARLESPELDSFIHDDRPPVVRDSELLVLRFTHRDDSPLATLLNWANHPETLGSKNTLITADYPAFLYRRLEERAGGLAILVNGALGGMQSPLGAQVVDPETGGPAPEASFRKAELIGARIAELAAEAAAKARPVPVTAVHYQERRVALPVSNPGFRKAAETGLLGPHPRIAPDGRLTTVTGLLRLTGPRGPVVEAALVPGELYPELSRGGIQRYPGADFPEAALETPIKALLRAPWRLLVGLANDEIGYIIPKAEWDEQAPWLNHASRRWYGEVNSLGPETAPGLLAALGKLIGPEPGRRR